jgi:hypothetical protein
VSWLSAVHAVAVLRLLPEEKHSVSAEPQPGRALDPRAGACNATNTTRGMPTALQGSPATCRPLRGRGAKTVYKKKKTKAETRAWTNGGHRTERRAAHGCAPWARAWLPRPRTCPWPCACIGTARARCRSDVFALTPVKSLHNLICPTHLTHPGTSPCHVTAAPCCQKLNQSFKFFPQQKKRFFSHPATAVGERSNPFHARRTRKHARPIRRHARRSQLPIRYRLTCSPMA